MSIAALMNARAARRAGVSLTELMVAVSIVSIGILGMVGAFRYINIAIQNSKGKSIANNLAQEKIEVMKNKSYYRVLVTTALAEDDNFTPKMYYDAAPNGVETLNVGGINFERRVRIQKVSEDSDGELVRHSWNVPDTGLKEVTVYVVWQEGGKWRKLELCNLRDNPARTNLSATFSGTVAQSGGAPALQGAIVRAQENPARYAETDAAGAYTLAIEPGAYTLLASKSGYFSSKSPLYNITTSQSHNFQLPVMSSGSVAGTAWLRDHLVISQVVGSSVAVDGGDAEWVEVYNPTTWTWTMSTGLGTGANEVVRFSYKEAAETEIFPDFHFRAVSIAPGAYFLFSNTGTITAAGITRTADAVYGTDVNWANIDNVIQTGAPSSAGHVILSVAADSRKLDKVGWNATDNINGVKKHAEEYEGAAIVQSVGFSADESYTRRTYSGGITGGQGRCYDTQNNNGDFLVDLPLSSARAPRNSSLTEPCVSGTPAAGALVFSDDGLSSPVEAESDGDFSLVGVGTGTWTIYVSSGFVMSTGAFTGASSGFSVALGGVSLASANVYGYIAGCVTDVNAAPLSGKSMYAGGFQSITNTSGRYTLPAYPGDTAVTANYQTADSNYVEVSSIGVLVALGAVTRNVDFVLEKGGKIRGWVTTNGTDPLPDIPVTAIENGVEKGNGISGSDGYFLIWGAGISTGTYVVGPQLESGESATPSTATVSLSAGQTLFASTFTVSGAMGYIGGSVSMAGAPITTGVLICATTGTITGAPLLPPTINSALRSGTAIYYSVSSNARGEYSLPVRGGYTYNIYAWYTNWSGSTPSTASRQFTGVSVAAGQSVDKDFSW